MFPKRVGVHHTTVRNVLKTSGAKPCPKYKTQKLSAIHKVKRVDFSEWILKHFGCTRSQHKLRFLVNTDFTTKKQCPKFSDV